MFPSWHPCCPSASWQERAIIASLLSSQMSRDIFTQRGIKLCQTWHCCSVQRGVVCLWACVVVLIKKLRTVSGTSHGMCQRLQQAEMWIVICGTPMETVFCSHNTEKTLLMSALMFLLPKCSFSASSSLVQGNIPQGSSPCCYTASVTHPVQLLGWREKEEQKMYRKFQKKRGGASLETFHPVQGKKLSTASKICHLYADSNSSSQVMYMKSCFW